MKLKEITKITRSKIKVDKKVLLNKYNIPLSELKLLNNNKESVKKGEFLILPVEEVQLSKIFRDMAKDKKLLKKLHEMKLFADENFYLKGEDTGFLDWQYDILKEVLSEVDPNYKPPVGAKIREGENRAELPFWMGSMDKFKPENVKEIDNWIKKHKAKDYVIEDKLDGVSCLIEYKSGSIKMYTRGDGVVGANISALLPYFNTIPKHSGTKELDIFVRGELIMKKKVFEKDYSKEYANPRNLVAGRIGAKTIRKGIEDIDFVAYELVGDGTMINHVKQMDYLKKLGFLTVRRNIVKKLSVEILSKNLVEFKKQSPYEIDGIIIQAVKNYERNVDGNPDYAFAFKMRLGDSIRKTEVLKVIWNISKWGQIKPKVKIKTLNLGGVKIDHATCHNAKYVVDNKIGPGAEIKITRSGDVIPYIVEVIKGAKKAQMPDIPYIWNKTGVDIIATDSSKEICLKLMESFFSKIGTKHLKEATIKKLYSTGLDTILKIIAADKKDFLKVDGIEEKGAERLYNNIQKSLKDITIPKIIGASQLFGFGVGVKRVTALFQDYPDILKDYKSKTKKKLLERIRNIEGFDSMAENIVENIKDAALLIKRLTQIGVKFKIQTRISEKLKGKKIVFSGFRDKELQEKIEQNGGKVNSSVSKNTSYLVVKSLGGKLTGKPKKASELGVKIITKEDLLKLF